MLAREQLALEIALGNALNLAVKSNAPNKLHFMGEHLLKKVAEDNKVELSSKLHNDAEAVTYSMGGGASALTDASKGVSLKALKKSIGELDLGEQSVKFWSENKVKLLFDLLGDGTANAAIDTAAFSTGVSELSWLTAGIGRLVKDPDPLDLDNVLSQTKEKDEIPMAVLSEAALATIKAGSTLRESGQRLGGLVKKKQEAVELSRNEVDREKHTTKLKTLQTALDDVQAPCRRAICTSHDYSHTHHSDLTPLS
jgi:hypothetical protein